MARGWESKSIELQQADAERHIPRQTRPLTPQEAALARQRDLLVLSRKRVTDQLQSATNPNQRNMLEAALKDLDRQIRALDDPSEPSS